MSRIKKIQLAKEVVIVENAQLKWRNELISGKWNLTLNEIRMLFVMTSQIDKNADTFEYCRISASELGKTMGLSSDKQYQTIKRTASKLLKRGVEFEWYKTPSSKKKSWMGATWFSWITYDDETSTVEWRFNELIEPLLLKVREAYVQLATTPLIAFKSIYSSRFMLLFNQWEKIGSFQMSIEEIKEHFKITEKYKFYKDFNLKVVEPAIKEINTFTDYIITAKPIKTGRSYTHYRFVIKRKRKKAIAVTATPARLNEQQTTLFHDLTGYGLEKSFAEAYVTSRTPEDTKANLDYALQKKDTAKDFPAYLRTCLEHDYGVQGLFVQQQEEAAAEAKLTPDQRRKKQELKEQLAEVQAAADKYEQEHANQRPTDKEHAAAMAKAARQRLLDARFSK